MKRSGCFILGMSVFLCASLGMNLVLFFISLGSLSGGGGSMRSIDLPLHEATLVDSTDDSKDKIVVVPLKGVISSSISGSITGSMVDDIKYMLEKAISDPQVKAIVVQIDSPGGEVTASDVIYNAIVKARKEKPVVIYMDSMAASGGYYAACGGSYLMASDTTITGSIGVIIQTLNYRDLLGKVGLDAVVFKSGKFKDILSGSREMTEEEQSYIQALVMQTYGKFVGIVSEERKLPEQELRAGIADGRIVSGADAKTAKLIDALGYVEDAYAKAQELGNAKGAAVVSYVAPFRLGNLLRLVGETSSRKVEVTLGDPFLPKLESGRLYLLPGFYAP